MTTTIRETDIAITDLRVGTRHGRQARYRLDARTPAARPVIPLGRMADNYAEALQARADIVDELAGSARVGDVVRIGFGQMTYQVASFGPGPYSDGVKLNALEYPYRTRNYVPTERLHVVKAVR